MSFVLSDAGRGKSSRPKQKRDCTVRSLAIVLGLGYDAAFELLKGAGRKTNGGFDIEAYARKNAPHGFLTGNFRNGETTLWTQFYFRLQKMPFSKGMRYGLPKSTQRYRLYDFIKDRPQGRFIVATARHVFAVVDGTVYDDLPWHYEENRAVYAWMELLPASSAAPLWQASAVKPAIKPGGRRYRRAVAVVPGVDYRMALSVATKLYDWALRKGEDLEVTPFQ